MLPVINTGIAHKEPGVGQIGAGVTRAPLACFTQAVAALATEAGSHERKPGLAVVAIGGNALIRDRSHESIPDQYEMAARSPRTSRT